MPKRFRIAFSFAAEKRDFVSCVAGILAQRFEKAAILYDKFHKAEFARDDLVAHLTNLYRNESDLIVVVFCPDYDHKEWCGLEWKTIRGLLKQGKTAEIMLTRFERVEPELLEGLAGYIDLDHETPESAATLILERLATNERKPRSAYLPSGPPGGACAPPCGALQSGQIGPYRLPTSGGNLLIGRDGELAILRSVWHGTNIRIVQVVAPAGMGKTHLVKHWRDSLALNANHNRLERLLEWSFAAQSPDLEICSEGFFDWAFRWLGETGFTKDPIERGHRLALLLGRHQTLLILDGLEALQHPSGPNEGGLADPSICALLRSLVFQTSCVCVVTTRLAVLQINEISPLLRTAIHLKPLDAAAGARLLRECGVVGAEKDVKAASNKFDGHPLALLLLGTILRDRFHGDINKIDQVALSDVDNRHSYTAMNIVASYIHWLNSYCVSEYDQLVRGASVAILALIALLERPADTQRLRILRNAPAIPGLTDALFAGDQRKRDKLWDDAVGLLTRAQLLFRTTDSAGDVLLDAHPLIYEFMGKRTEEGCPQAVRVAHQRLFEHYRDKASNYPASIAGMIDCLYAVRHACKAGLEKQAFDEIFDKRIQRGREHYCTSHLGAFSLVLQAISAFPITEDVTCRSDTLALLDCAILLSTKGFALRVLGRNQDAMSPLSRAFHLYQSLEHWSDASEMAENLFIAQESIGDYPNAYRNSVQSLIASEKTNDPHFHAQKLASHAFCALQLGNRKMAQRLFHKAEALQGAAADPIATLYAVPGYHFCDLMLDDVVCLTRVPASNYLLDQAREMLRSILKRANIAEGLAPLQNDGRVSRALSLVNSGRALTQCAIVTKLSGGGLEDFILDLDRAGHCFEEGLNLIEGCGRGDFLPRAFLGKAEWLREMGQLDAAEMSANKALRIAKEHEKAALIVDSSIELARISLNESHFLCFQSSSLAMGFVEQQAQEIPDLSKGAQTWPRQDAKLLKVEAVVQTFKIQELKYELQSIGVGGVTVTECRGFGRQRGHTEVYRGSEYTVNFLPKSMLTVVITADLLGEVERVITKTARRGQIGDGKVFILPVEAATRIRTGETGAAAVNNLCDWDFSYKLDVERVKAVRDDMNIDYVPDFRLARVHLKRATEWMADTERQCLRERDDGVWRDSGYAAVDKGVIIGYHRRIDDIAEINRRLEECAPIAK